MELTKVKRIRNGHKSAITRLFTKLDELSVSTAENATQIRTALDTLVQKRETILQLNEKILLDIGEDDVEEEITEADEYIFMLDCKIAQIKKSLDESRTNSEKPAQSQLNANAQDFIPDKSYSDIQLYPERSIPSSISSNFHKLPKLHLPKFNGDILTWQSFWDSFETTVHLNNSLTEIQKFNYLKSLLENEAVNVIMGLTLTNDNYKTAIALLRERFGQKHKIVNAYMKSLLELPTPSSSVSDLRIFCDRTEICIRGLESLGQTQDMFGALLIPIILDKLPHPIRMTITRENRGDEWSIQTLRETLKRELDILESGMGSGDNVALTANFYTANASKSKSVAPVAKNQKAAKMSHRNTGSNDKKLCMFCDLSHPSRDCTLPTNEKHDIVKRKGLCFNCLGNHRISKCESKHNCKKCGKRHHTYLCREIKADKDVALHVSSEDNDSISQQKTLSDNASTALYTLMKDRSVLLKTAIANVTFEHQMFETNILFDEGAQKSYITEDLARKLDLKHTGTETLTIASFGGKEMNRTLKTATVFLVANSDEKIPINVIIVPTIAAPLQINRTSMKTPAYLRNLKLAHPLYDSESTFNISLLIGADHYWDIVEDHVIRGSGPTAVSSKIGYLLSGPSDKPLNKFIMNRKREIETLTKQHVWKYVPTTSNPADLQTRGISFKTFSDSSLWMNGPSWLANKSQWPQWDICKATILTVQTQQDDEYSSPSSTGFSGISELININRFNNLGKLIRVTSYVLRFIRNCKLTLGHRLRQNTSMRVEPPRLSETKLALMTWIKDVQQREFQKEIETMEKNKNNSTLVKQLKLYIDSQCIIRCRGRIDKCPLRDSAKFPILLPKKHTFTNLVVMDVHARMLHSGCSQTVTEIRQTFWIPSIRQVVNHILRACVKCRRVIGRPYQLPDPPPLPKDRVSECLPFSVTGVDFAGPLYVKTKNQPNKMYICLFTCAVSRAVHLELVQDLSVDSFVLALRRCISNKGMIHTMYSDNGATFKAAPNAVMNQIGLSINWKFITKGAPWQGGFWERMIGITKTTLKKILGKCFVNEVTLRTILCEAESVINDRPLTYVSSSVNDPEPLTPSHLLQGRKKHTGYFCGPEDDSDNFTLNCEMANRCYKRKLDLISNFTKRWKHEYLTALREYHRTSGTNNQSVAVGDVVLIYDVCPRANWKLGIIIELINGTDNLVRSAKVRLKTGNITSRPISKLFPLEL